MSTDAATLARFRAAIANLDPTRPPDGSAEQNWYVNRPDSVERELVARLALEPTCHCAIVGPIGSGKSSALKAIERALEATPGVMALYVDPSLLTDLSKATEWSVAVAVGSAAANTLPARFPGIQDAGKALTKWGMWAGGYVDPYQSHFDESAPDGWVPGFLDPHPEPFEGRLRNAFEALVSMAKTLANETLVLLIDGLDRLPTVQRFEALVAPLLAELRFLKIGAVVVSPWRTILGTDRIDSEQRFDEIGELGALLSDSGAVELSFFDRILTARSVRDLFSDDAVAQMAHFSGGLMRDFMQLAKQALTLAWVDGRRAAEVRDATRSADRLGRSRLLGLTDDDLKLLENVHRTGHFAARTPEQQALVVTGRIIQSNGPVDAPRTWLHPALVHFFMAELGAKLSLDAGA